MKRKLNIFWIIFIYLFFIISPGFAQMKNFFATPTAPGGEKTETPASSKTEDPKQPVASESTGVKFNGIPVYDPFMDNHLKAPIENIGLFGLKIRDVERVLRNHGAKDYSYAFGKYSKMNLSVYVLTMYFDRDQKVGGVSIEPKPPFSKIEPNARKFFMDLFLKGNDISKFRTLISSGRLELRYDPQIQK